MSDDTASDAKTAIDQIERLIAGIMEPNAFLSIESRRHLVAMRRLLPARFEALDFHVTRELTAAGRHDDLHEFRTRQSAMKRVLAVHQATWPAVIISDDPAGFRASLATTFAAYSAFIRWTKAAIASSG